MRTFDTGATRNPDTDKLDYEGFLSPRVLKRFAEYMHKNRYQADGNLRDSDNWQKGMPPESYMKSGFRHFMEWWESHRQRKPNTWPPAEMEEALCALLFNVQGYLHELLKLREAMPQTEDVPVYHAADEVVTNSMGSQLTFF